MTSVASSPDGDVRFSSMPHSVSPSSPSGSLVNGQGASTVPETNVSGLPNDQRPFAALPGNRPTERPRRWTWFRAAVEGVRAHLPTFPVRLDWLLQGAVSAIIPFYPGFHEMGHALAAVALFRDVHPTIRLGIRISETLYGGPAEDLTPAGTALGLCAARAAVTAAGPVADIALSTFHLMAAHALSASHPSLAESLAVLSWSRLSAVAYYACRDFLVGHKHRITGDFTDFSDETGISPALVLSVTLAVTTPLFWLAFKTGTNTWV